MTRYKVETWEERDRIGIWVVDTHTDKTIWEVWDNEAREMIEDGFINPRDIEGSVLRYLTKNKIIGTKSQKIPEFIKI